MSTNKNRSQASQASRNYRAKNNEQKKRKRLKRQTSEGRARKRKRAHEIQKLTQSDEDIPMMEIICQTKRGFPDRMTALLCKPDSSLSIYECKVCMGFHFTSQKQKNA